MAALPFFCVADSYLAVAWLLKFAGPVSAGDATPNLANDSLFILFEFCLSSAAALLMLPNSLIFYISAVFFFLPKLALANLIQFLLRIIILNRTIVTLEQHTTNQIAIYPILD